MAELGGGSGSGYPAVLDTDTTKEANDGEASPTTARAECINDAYDAIVKIETELGIAPSGAYDDVVTRLDAYSHNFLGSWYDNLIIKNNASHADHQVDVNADVILIDWYKKTTLDLTIDMAAAGANGLMTGLTEAASTWYYIWVICTPPSTFAGILTTYPTIVATMPAGYTKSRLVGAIYNDAGKDFDSMTQYNNIVACAETSVVSAGTATDYTGAATTAVIPPIANKVYGTFNVGCDTAASLALGYVSPTDDGLGSVRVGGHIAAIGYYIYAPFKIQYIHSNLIYYKVSASAGTATGNVLISGWEY